MNLTARLRAIPLDVLTALQVITAVGLAYDAKIHFKLAPVYDSIKSSTISQGDLFRIEAWLAVVAAILVLVGRKPILSFIALAVAGGGLVPLLVYRYYDIGAVGPLPPMYEPAWYPDKTNTAWAQAIAAVAALIILVVVIVRARKKTQTEAQTA
jgi:hypothetical protein